MGKQSDMQVEQQGGDLQEHLYNSWLPVAQEAKSEKQRFHDAVGLLKSSWQPQNLHTRFATLKWISVLNTFLKVKSQIAIADLEDVVKTAFDVLLHSPDNLFIQVRWGQSLAKILKIFGKKLNITVDWRPLYKLLAEAHFKRRQGYEGLVLKQIHLQTMTSLVRSCRQFFPPGAAVEIWMEFRRAFEDLSHNSSLEAIGFIALFLPSMLHKQSVEDRELLTRDWLMECLRFWVAIPNCRFWNHQWASLLSRFIKHNACSVQDWEPVLPILFTQYLRSFEVPVGRASASSPVQRNVPREVMLAFSSGWSFPTSKFNAKSIVFLLSQSGPAQKHLDILIDLLEQYFHPSNGGSWTSSLEQFLRYLVHYFLKRLAAQRHEGGSEQLGSEERAAFVKGMVRLIERGQYSKNGSLASTAAHAAAGLAFVEPLLVLPLLVSRFHTAMDTITATHQLQTAVTSLALVARPIILVSARQDILQQSEMESLPVVSLKDTLVVAMFSTLLGMDANDPPKTLATLQFYCSVFSSVGILGDQSDGGSVALPMDWSQWLDDFLSRLFTLLVHLEPSSPSGEVGSGDGSLPSSKTFLMQGESFYHHVLELLFARLTRPLYQQAVRRVAKFLQGEVLPGAVAEVGLLCSAVVYACPAYAVPQLLEPLMSSILSCLADTQSTGFSGNGVWASSAEFKVGLPQGLEVSAMYQLNVLAIAVMFGGSALLCYEKLFTNVIATAFDAPSSKVNEAGSRVLSGLLGSLVLYYPLDQYKVHAGVDGTEVWLSTKDTVLESLIWHHPSTDEIAFANSLLSLHLQCSLADLRSICQDKNQADTGKVKEHLRVLLLRVDASLRGVRSCLPDFQAVSEDHSGLILVAGAAGAFVASTALKEEAADTLHLACQFLLKERADDTVLLMMLVRIVDLLTNYGGIEYSHWIHGRHLWRSESKSLTEPKTNFITNSDGKGKCRPWWLVVEMVYMHHALRASQNGYRCFHQHIDGFLAPSHVALLSMDLLALSLHRYDAVRLLAGNILGKTLKRFPSLVSGCMPLLTASLQDPEAIEDSALGACRVLMSQPVLRHLMQDWSAFSSFLVALLKSSHHDSVKAQTAINELFIVFNVRYGGLPISSLSNVGDTTKTLTYTGLLSHIKDHVADGAANIHWRYNLMAQGMLLLLVSPPAADANSATSEAFLLARQLITGQFLTNLKSKLPPLRPLSVAALLLLLQPARDKMTSDRLTCDTLQKEESGAPCVDNVVTTTFDEAGFGDQIIENLGFDHLYAEGQGRGARGGGLRTMPELGLTALLPSFLRDWPHTQTWDSSMNGVAFSSSFAKLFQRLVQDGREIVLDALHGPVEEAVSAGEDRGKQCVAAEVMAGLLHSDVVCVVDAWKVWLRPLLHRALLHSTVESAPEWAACLRFSVTGKGHTGCRAPVLRSHILESLAEPLAPASASTSLVSKRLMFLRAAIVEVLPASRSNSDNLYQASLLSELMTCMTHPASQVREGVGKLMCVVGANLTLSVTLHEQGDSADMAVEESGVSVEEIVRRWCAEMVDGATTSAAKIQTKTGATLGDTALAALGGSDVDEIEIEAASKWMETALHFLIASVKSGRAVPLNRVVVGLLHPILSVQDTSDKELAALAKGALQLLSSAAPFESEQVGAAVAAVLAAASDANWHTRVAALTFLQSLVYRHTFILVGKVMVSLWSQVQELLSDPQLEVRELAAKTLAGMMKGIDSDLAEAFRKQALAAALSIQAPRNTKSRTKATSRSALNIAAIHGHVLGLAACVLSVPYDMPRWLPEIVTQLAIFNREPAPMRITVMKTIAEFRRTHSDTWMLQKTSFSEEQLEVLSDLTSSASYFA